MKTAAEFLKEKGLTTSSHVHSMSVESFSKLMEEYADQFKPKWISVEERMPGEEVVLAYNVKSKMKRVMKCIVRDGNWLEVGHLFKHEVTHWMPMFEMPNT